MIIKFDLQRFSLTIVNNFEEADGVQIYSNEFRMKVETYDTLNKFNVHSMCMSIENDEFGVNAVRKE